MLDRNIVEITDVTKKELEGLITRTLFFARHKQKIFRLLKGKRVGLLFDSNSLRTKLSFEIAVDKLGGFPYFVPIQSVTHENDQSLRECIEDVIETMDHFVDMYVVRDYSQRALEVLKRKKFPPFLNGFSEIGHPSQVLADLSLIKAKRGPLNGLDICAVVPETGSGIMESFVYALLMLGHHITLITPTGFFKGKNPDFDQVVSSLAGLLSVTKDPERAKLADVLYVDEWWENSKNFLLKKPPVGYQVDRNFVEGTKEDLLIMHCLPAHHDREISQEVIMSDRSVVFEEAEFRIYSAMAWLEFMCK